MDNLLKYIAEALQSKNVVRINKLLTPFTMRQTWCPEFFAMLCDVDDAACLYYFGRAKIEMVSMDDKKYDYDSHFSALLASPKEVRQTIISKLRGTHILVDYVWWASRQTGIDVRAVGLDAIAMMDSMNDVTKSLIPGILKINVDIDTLKDCGKDISMAMLDEFANYEKVTQNDVRTFGNHRAQRSSRVTHII